MPLKAREGDFIETFENLLFDVKGLVHPPDRTIAFLRYFPNKDGQRKRNGKFYSKVYSLSERYALLRNIYPQFLIYDSVFDENLCEVPVNSVKTHYKPAERLQELSSDTGLDLTETKALRLTALLREAAYIPWSAVGISGSIMVGLHTQDSDVDPIFYGSENCRRVRSALKELLSDKNGPFTPYTQRDLKALFSFRSKDTTMSFKHFVQSESRKLLQGKFLGRDYFIRFVKDWSEINEEYGDVRYVNVGYARVKATVADDSESFFTPCAYTIGNVQVLEGSQIGAIKEIASFRGRFCEQARNGEAVIAQGKVERVIDSRQDSEYFRLLLGNKPSDYMILA